MKAFISSGREMFMVVMVGPPILLSGPYHGWQILPRRMGAHACTWPGCSFQGDLGAFYRAIYHPACNRMTCSSGGLVRLRGAFRLVFGLRSHRLIITTMLCSYELQSLYRLYGRAQRH